MGKKDKYSVGVLCDKFKSRGLYMCKRGLCLEAVKPEQS